MESDFTENGASVSIRFSYNVQMQPLVNVLVVSGRRSALQACALGLLQ